MSSHDVEILSFGPQTPQFSVSFKPTPNLLTKSLSIQLEFRGGGHEAFVERTTFRELVPDAGEGTYVATVPEYPHFRGDDEVEVVMHVWKGERLIGSWDAGKYVDE
jgi:hypothetical protein